MTVHELNRGQMEELRQKIIFSYNGDDLEAVGAITDEWSEQDIEDWINDKVSDDLVKKSFDIYDFTVDDFWCNNESKF